MGPEPMSESWAPCWWCRSCWGNVRAEKWWERGKREQAAPSTSSSCSPSHLHAVLSTHACQMAWRQLLNCQNLSLFGPEGTNMAWSPWCPFQLRTGQTLLPWAMPSLVGAQPCLLEGPSPTPALCAWLRLQGMASSGWGHSLCPDHLGSWLSFPHGDALLALQPDIDYQKEVTNPAFLSSGSCGPWRIPSPEWEY